MTALKTIAGDLLKAQRQIQALFKIVDQQTHAPVTYCADAFWLNWRHTMQVQSFERMRCQHLLTAFGAANDERFGPAGDAA